MSEEDDSTVPDEGTLEDWPLPVLLAHVAAEPTTTSSIRVGDAHVLVVHEGDLAAVWTDGLDAQGTAQGTEQGTAEERLARAVALPGHVTWALHRGVDLLVDRKEADVDLPAFAAILAAARAWPDAARIDDEIASMLGDAPLRLDDPYALESFAPTDDEREVAALLSDPGVASYEVLLESADPSIVRPLVWALAVTQHLTTVPSTLLLAAEDHAHANAALEAGDVASAEAFAVRAVECDPRPEHRALLGYLRGIRGGKDELAIAIAILDRAIEDDPACARAYVHRARLRERAGRAAAAAADWAKALELDPEDPDAIRAVARAQTMPPGPPAAAAVSAAKKGGWLSSLGALIGGRAKP